MEQQGTDLIMNSGIVEQVLGISGLPDELAAQTLDVKMRGLEREWKSGFIQRGLILLEIEKRKLWSFIEDSNTSQPYSSMDRWVKNAAPASFSDCYAAMRAIKDLRDMPYEELVRIPRCNIEMLRLLSPEDRTGELEMEDGNRISVLAAARDMRKKEFILELRKRFPVTFKSSISIGDHLLGEEINFRGLQHGPVSEQGVVFLFGMVARELGYRIELVRTGFPDCEGKLRVAERGGKERWKRVRIEFELESRNFVEHKHDPSGCDVIVCWEHNWTECPATLEVVELCAEILKLDPNFSKED